MNKKASNPRNFKRAATVSKLSPTSHTGSNLPKKIFLYIHNESFSTEELILNPAIFPHLNRGDIVELSQSRSTTASAYPATSPTSPIPQSIQLHQFQQSQDSSVKYHHSKDGNISIILRVGHVKPAMKGVQFVSISKQIADTFDLQARKEVNIKLVPGNTVGLDYVELAFKDQFISRSDMWRFTLYLANQSAYVSKTFEFNGMRAQVKELMLKQNRVSSGLITKHTKFTFRSRSASIFWIFQMSSEMWEYAEDGDLYFEKAANGFARELLTKWENLNVHHSLSIIFFSRHFVKNKTKRQDLNQNNATNDKHLSGISFVPHIHTDGREYIDVYKVICLNERNVSVKSVVTKLRQEFFKYHRAISEISSKYDVDLENSNSCDGNFLEATNLVLNLFDNHHINRDLSRTGQNIVILSAGVGVFSIIDKTLSSITKQRLIDNGIAIDLICLSNPPMHLVPIFKLQKYDSQKKQNITYYRLAEWLNAGFYRGKTYMSDYVGHQNSEQNFVKNINSESGSHFIPICKMKTDYDITLVGQDNLQIPIQCHQVHIKHSENGPKYHLQIPKSRSTSDFSIEPGVNSSNMDNEIGRNSVNVFPDTLTEKSIYDEYDECIFETYNNDQKYKQTNTPVTESSSTRYKNYSSASSEKGIQTSETVSAQTRLYNSNSTTSSIQIPEEMSNFSRSADTTKEAPTEEFTPSLGGTKKIENDTKSTELGSIMTSSKNTQTDIKLSSTPIFTKIGINPFDVPAPHLSIPETTSQFIKLKNSNSKNAKKLAVHFQRWYHLCPNSFTFAMSKMISNDTLTMPQTLDLGSNSNLNWPSLTEPACLPLSTEFWFDSKKDEDYVVSLYTVLADDHYDNKRDMLLRELISQRLHQGFQIYLESNKQHENDSSKQIYHLCISDQFHQIMFDTFNSSSIIIKRYTPKNEDSKQHQRPSAPYPKYQQQQQQQQQQLNSTTPPTKPINYHYLLIYSSSHSESVEFISQNTVFKSQRAIDYNWNYLDYLVSGFHDEMTNNLKFRCLQFHLIRSPSLKGNPKDTAENRVNDFLEFKKWIVERTSFKPANGSIDVEILGLAGGKQYNTVAGDYKIIKLERKKTTNQANELDRYEWINFVYKESYHPSESYVFQLQWLVCNGCIVSDFVQALIRRAAHHNFSMIPTPILFNEMSIQYIHPFIPQSRIQLYSQNNVLAVKKILVSEKFNFIPEYMPIHLAKRFIHEAGQLLVLFDNITHSMIWIENLVMNNFQSFGIMNNTSPNSNNTHDMKQAIEREIESIVIAATIVNEMINNSI